MPSFVTGFFHLAAWLQGSRFQVQLSYSSIKTSFLFMAESCSVSWWTTQRHKPHVFICLSGDGPLGSFHFGAFMNNAAVDIHVQVLCDRFSSWSFRFLHSKMEIMRLIWQGWEKIQPAQHEHPVFKSRQSHPHLYLSHPVAGVPGQLMWLSDPYFL